MNNFTELSSGDGAKFLVRWRGRQEGPYSASIIEAKLAANEIGLLHEMLHNGQWITIRDYVTKMEAMLRVKHQEREEQELQARKEAEQQMNEREDLRRIDFERGEQRRREQAEAAKTQPMAEVPPRQIYRPTSSNSPLLQILGGLLLAAGLAIAAYFFLVFEASVKTESGRVMNLGLMADRQNGIIIGIGLGVVGTIMLVVGSRGKN